MSGWTTVHSKINGAFGGIGKGGRGGPTCNILRDPAPESVAFALRSAERKVAVATPLSAQKKTTALAP